MSDTSIRYLAMLSLIPGRPYKITAREVHEKLKAQGYDIHVRSIERDLPKLSGFFPLISDDGRPAGWSWESRDQRITFPRMDAGTALTYELVARYLAPVLPRQMSQDLEPDFSSARRVLNELGASPLGKWSKRIAVLPSGHLLLAPDIRTDVREVVYDALLLGKRFEADYRALEAEKPRRYVFNPQGLVYRENVLYLVATLWDYEDIRQFTLHRMSNARLATENAMAVQNFDLQRYVREEKSFDFPAGKLIRLQLKVAPWLARHLDERRLSADQRITSVPDKEMFKVTATLAETEQLYWWLRGLGPDAEIVKPAPLRRRMARDVAASAKLYRSNN